MEADIALIVVLAAAFLLGYLRGAVRQLIVVGAFLVAFIVAAYMRGIVGDWIASNASAYPREHVDMLAFLASFLVLFSLAVLVIEIGGSTIQLTRRATLDQLLGGFLAVGAALLTIAAVAIALDTYYLAGPVPGAAELGITRDLYLAFERSGIVRAMHDSLIPGLIALLGPLLPQDIRAVYA